MKYALLSRNHHIGEHTAAGVLSLSNGATAPSDSANQVQLYSVDLAANNAILGIFTETAVASEVVACDTTLTIKVNGTNYKLLMHT